MTKKLIIVALIVAILILGFVTAYRYQKNKTPAIQETAQNPITVKAVPVSALRTSERLLEFPATIVGDQEVELTSTSSGTASFARFASAWTAAIFISSLIADAWTSRAPRKMNGNPSTLLTWLG